MHCLRSLDTSSRLQSVGSFMTFQRYREPVGRIFEIRICLENWALFYFIYKVCSQTELNFLQRIPIVISLFTDIVKAVVTHLLLSCEETVLWICLKLS